MTRFKVLALATATFVATMGTTIAAQAAQPALAGAKIQRVLLISIDGMHQVDLANWIAHNPQSSLALLSSKAITYTAARTTTPSDSFPGLLAMVTGGTPKSTGVYYDDSYDRTLYAPGSNCTGNPGIEAVYDESIDHDMNQLFSGGINPAGIVRLKMTTCRNAGALGISLQESSIPPSRQNDGSCRWCGRSDDARD